MANEQFKTAIALVTITATSNKQSDGFKQETPTKTVYFTAENEKSRKALTNLGLTEYTPQDKEAKPYFASKAVKDIKLYDYSQNEIGIQKATTDVPNFYTKDQVMIAVTHTKPAEKGKNSFYRVTAFLVADKDQIKEAKPQNPFAELFADGENVDLPF